MRDSEVWGFMLMVGSGDGVAWCTGGEELERLGQERLLNVHCDSF
jgi:hypothetical protein